MSANDEVLQMFRDFTGWLVGWVWSPYLFFLLLGCGLIFSIVSKFVQWRILTHGYACIRGDYDKPDDTGHINHFQALCAALSATVGLGNIAGVAVAISIGGPGAVFWMWIVGVFGMALKFMECSLALMFRDVRKLDDDEPGEEREEVRGGPMWYIQKALVDPLKARGNILWPVFKVLAVLYAVSTVLNSLGSGNMFQGWNVSDIVHSYFSVPTWISAIVVSVLVGLVIIGGIKRIGQVASKLVPFMCVIYVAGAMYVLIIHASDVPRCLASIFEAAFTPTAGAGGFAGTTVWIAFTQGLRRACFSNEAGEGSAAMAHAAAKTDEPIREGVVAGIGPFVDTLIICTMSALILLITGVWNRPPVGKVVAVGPSTVFVATAEDLPETFQPIYLDAIENMVGHEKHALAVVLEHEQGQEPKSLLLHVSSLDGDPAQGWSGVKGFALSMPPPEKRDRSYRKIEAGLPVHLDLDGAAVTAFAFDTAFDIRVFRFGKWMVTLGVCLFAFSTMISWSYYGETGAEYLFGPKAILPYKCLFVVFVFLGMRAEKFQTVYDFSDATVGLMVLCNLPALLILSPVVLRAAKDYFGRLDRGEMPRQK